MPTLTKKQADILAYVRDHIAEQGYAPSYREIADHFGLSSPATIHQYIKTLTEKGYINISNDGSARSIELLFPQPIPLMNHGGGPSPAMATSSLFLPLAGLIAAGMPIEAIEEKETMAVPTQFVVDGANSYVLKVKGQSMIEDGILNGDFVIIERNPSPKNGEVVVALLDNAYATLKRFYREPHRIRLQPANHTMDPIYVKDCIIQGVVRAVIRKFQAL